MGINDKNFTNSELICLSTFLLKINDEYRGDDDYNTILSALFKIVNNRYIDENMDETHDIESILNTIIGDHMDETHDIESILNTTIGGNNG